MIYLDNNATTQIDPNVLEAMHSTTFGNPSSMHRFGQRARAQLQQATRDVATHFGVRHDEVIFTSGATEGLHYIISGLSPRHVVTSSLEHIATLQAIEKTGCEATFLYPEEGMGAIAAEAIEEALRPDTDLITILAANNETGVKSDLEKIAQLAHERNIPLLVDAAAWVGREPFPFFPGITAFVCGGHKMHGPLGVGVVIVRRSLKLKPLLPGGPQQHGKRAGTENLPAIVGMAHALTRLDDDSTRIASLRDYFEQKLKEQIPDLLIHGEGEERICTTSNLAFPGQDGETLLIALDQEGVAASHGAACSSGSLQPSRVLRNMGLSPEVVRSSLRFSLSRFTTASEVERAVEIIARIVTTVDASLTTKAQRTQRSQRGFA